jgi:hypothetical protein
MPIRPEMKPLYPPAREWKVIRARILERAGNACECRGECGLVHQYGRCEVPNHGKIQRKREGIVNWHFHEACSLCLGGDNCGAVFVVLTIAHLDHDPRNNVDANLAAFCQLCHLRYDREEHATNSAETRARKRDEQSGQAALFIRNTLRFSSGKESKT